MSGLDEKATVKALIDEGRKRSAVVDNYEGKNYLIRRLTDALERAYLAASAPPAPDVERLFRAIEEAVGHESPTGRPPACRGCEVMDRFGMIDPASGHEPLYFGKVNDVEDYAIAGEQYVRLADYEALRARLETVEAETRERCAKVADPVKDGNSSDIPIPAAEKAWRLPSGSRIPQWLQKTRNMKLTAATELLVTTNAGSFDVRAVDQNYAGPLMNGKGNGRSATITGGGNGVDLNAPSRLADRAAQAERMVSEMQL